MNKYLRILQIISIFALLLSMSYAMKLTKPKFLYKRYSQKKMKDEFEENNEDDIDVDVDDNENEVQDEENEDAVFDQDEEIVG